MHFSNYETRATIKLHQQALLDEASRDRMLTEAQKAGPRRILVATGRLLVTIGTWLEDRYTNAATAAPGNPESCLPMSA